jgi:hypothetical protein
MKLKIDTTKTALRLRGADWQQTKAQEAPSLIPGSQPAELITWQFQRLGISSLGHDRPCTKAPEAVPAGIFAYVEAS